VSLARLPSQLGSTLVTATLCHRSRRLLRGGGTAATAPHCLSSTCHATARGPEALHARGDCCAAAVPPPPRRAASAVVGTYLLPRTSGQ
jgi:hypothetical protein